MRKIKKESHRSKSHSPKASVAEHERALSLAVAKEANKDSIVKAFRSEILKGRLLSWDQVQGWVDDQAARDREGLDHGELFSVSGDDVPVQQPVYDQSFLYYAQPNRIEKFLPAIEDGVLSRLRRLSESLANRYCWQP